jgi:hypothetical protein
MSSNCAGSARRQAGANPRSRRCSCQSCGRFLESATSRVGVSSIGCWPTRIARTISGERIRETHEHRHIIAPHAKPRRHGVDAVITARKEHVAGCDRSGDQRGKAVVDRFRGAIADHQPHTLSRPAKACAQPSVHQGRDSKPTRRGAGTMRWPRCAFSRRSAPCAACVRATVAFRKDARSSEPDHAPRRVESMWFTMEAWRQAVTAA